MADLPIALEWTVFSVGTLLVILLFGGLLVPFLIKEIRDGKRDFGPLRRLRRGGVTLGPDTPSGASDINPGRVGDPAPGEPSGQPNPWDDVKREAPRIRS